VWVPRVSDSGEETGAHARGNRAQVGALHPARKQEAYRFCNSGWALLLCCYVEQSENALPTFVRAMSKTFGGLIRARVEVYVDDIMVKTKKGSTLVEDLTLVFDKLRATRTKLNPDKCVFGVSARKFMGFLVSY
jgi:hypothetical protein